MTEAALSYHNTILNSYLIGFDEKCPEYLEMIDAYMKGTFFDFFYTKEFAYWIKNEDLNEPYYEKDALYFKRQGKYGIVTSEHYQLSMGGTINYLWDQELSLKDFVEKALDEWQVRTQS